MIHGTACHALQRLRTFAGTVTPTMVLCSKLWQHLSDNALCSFFPIFPPPLGTCLDTTLARYLKLQAVPDILVLPSDLNSFAKLLPMASPDSEQCLCINPGRLVKGHGGGTFAHIHVLPGPQGQKLSQSCKVEIKKL